MADAKPFKPALIIVDFQEDFCPPVRLSPTTSTTSTSLIHHQSITTTITAITIS